MLPITHRDYVPVSREDHYRKMQAFIDSVKGLPPGKFQYEHILSDGVYIRKMKLQKNVVVIGAVHRRETAMIILNGSVKIFSESGLRILKAGDIVIAPPGTQRAAFALEDTVLVTLHRADSTSVYQIMSDLAEGDISEYTGITEGKYKLYINGRKEIDAEIHSSSKEALADGHLQRVLFGGHHIEEPHTALHNPALQHDN